MGERSIECSHGKHQSLKLVGKTTVVGLAKNVEEIFYPGDSESAKTQSFQSETLKFIKTDP
jgi:excinuclease ABC subunit C